MIGSTVSHYKITGKLGEGGMGEVYRAEDTQLGREVAIKVLPEALADDPERLARFEREARVLAALDHGNIATVFGFEEAGGRKLLVMHLAEGETLEKRLESGPIPVDEALPMMLQIAGALEAAHAKGIIHRDLKPANVKVTEGGQIKVLDFGLAKALEQPSTEADATLSRTDTLAGLSGLGLLLGTPGYMSPEQARGQQTDARTDIWSFGCLLFELLTGTAAFAGETARDSVAAVLTQRPDLDALPAGIPPEIRALLRRCLRKDQGRRMHAIADVRVELEDCLEELREGLEAADEIAVPEKSARVERTFRLTAELCRQLDRESLDPRVIGDDILYLDNECSSEVLVCYLPGLGLDHRIFEETLNRSPYRGLATNFYGCEPDPERRLAMSMTDQLTVLKHFLVDAIDRLSPEIVILAGFSLGADTAFRLLSETDLDPGSIDGILGLGTNLNLDTCVFSSRLARVTGAAPDEVLPALREIGESVTRLDEWVEVYRYLSEVVWKYRSHLGVLRSLAEGCLDPFTDTDRRPFAEWYRRATENGIAVRCVLTDTHQEQGALRELQLEHLDCGILGESFDHDDFFRETRRSHFELLDLEVIERHLDVLVTRVRARRSG